MSPTITAIIAYQSPAYYNPTGVWAPYYADIADRQPTVVIVTPQY